MAESGAAAAAPAATDALPAGGGACRVVDLERLASALADQRLQLAEQWQRLVRGQQRWEQQRADAARELEAMAQPLQEQEQTLTERERACRMLEEGFRKKQRELVQMRQHLMGWRARLRACEATWEGERKQLLAEIRHRETLVDDHLKTLVDVRQHWTRQRRQELEKLQAQQASCTALGREYLELREEWQRRCAAAEEEKRQLAEKTLSLEQLREETILRSGNSPASQRRLQRLRRAWLSQNAAAIRTFNQERQALKKELAALAARHAELGKLQADALAAEARLAEKRANWEQTQSETSARFAQMAKDLNVAVARRQYVEEQLGKMKEEIEQVAHTLLEEPEMPAVAADRAA
jgi:hypothetical protein